MAAPRRRQSCCSSFHSSSSRSYTVLTDGRGGGSLELIADIRKTFDSQFGVDADIRLRGDAPILILFGPSGAGKTTVLRCIAGLEPLTSGRIVFGGEDWTSTPPQKRSVGYVFQEYALFPHLDVEANIAYGLHGLD